MLFKKIMGHSDIIQVVSQAIRSVRYFLLPAQDTTSRIF